MKKLVSAIAMTAVIGSSFAIPAKATGIVDGVKGIFGVVIGTPVSMVSGLTRGTISQGVRTSHDLTDQLGGGLVGTVIGTPIGFVVGGAAGAIGGTVKGTFNGLSNGYDHPFTSTSFGLDGEFLDYHPMDIL